MKKVLALFFASFIFLFFLVPTIQAADPVCDDSNGGQSGLVPCGVLTNAAPAGSPPGTQGTLACRCELVHIFLLARNIYNFIVWKLALPVAGLLIVLGGGLILFSGVSPKWYDRGKTMAWGAVWGIGLILGSYLIVDLVLKGLGYTGVWNSF